MGDTHDGIAWAALRAQRMLQSARGDNIQRKWLHQGPYGWARSQEKESV